MTLSFTTLMFLVFRNEEWLTGGVSGIGGIPRPSLFGLSLNGAAAFCYLCLAVLAVVTLAVWQLVRSPWGRAFVALRENPMRAASLGVDTRRYTLMAFAIGSALGGLAGAFYAPLVQYIEPASFGLGLSLNLLLMVVIGGSGFFYGPFLGALIAILLPEWLRFSEGLYLMLYALAVMVLMAVSPKGLLGLVDRYTIHRGNLRASAARATAKAKHFGGIKAVDGVSFDVNEGEILGIIGPNGCGKSTLFNCILGQLRPTDGAIHLDGRDVTGTRPADLNRLGVSRTFQLLQIFPQLSVRENLVLAGQEHVGSMLSRLVGPRDAGLGEAADKMIDFFKMGHLAGQRAGGLSYGQQKLLDAAMAFMAGPRLVLLDEPAGGVNLTMLGELEGRLRAMNAEQGATFVVIEHNMEFVMSLCTRVVVMAEGRVLTIGTPDEVRRDPRVIEAYLGH